MTNALLAQRGEVDFAVEAAIEGDIRVAWLSGELDLAAAPRIAHALAETTGMARQRLVLDLSNLDFVDAAGLGAIVRARNSLRSRSGDLTLRSPSRFAARVLEIGGLASLVSPSAPNRGHELASEQKLTPAA